MTIAWIYLDKKAAAISALKDYASMEHILTVYPEDAEEARLHLTTIPTPVFTDTPSAASPHAAEGHVARALDLIDVLKERYQRALEYMAWFQPAWALLTDEERYILEQFYLRADVSRPDILQQLGTQLRLERTAVYSRKDKAAAHLALLLYGK